MFINKEEIIKSIFITQNKKGTYVAKSGLYRQEFEKENIQIILREYGADVEYLTDNQLYEKYEGDLPDNVDGYVTLFLNTEDTIKIVKNEIFHLKKEQAKIKKQNSIHKFY